MTSASISRPERASENSPITTDITEKSLPVRLSQTDSGKARTPFAADNRQPTMLRAETVGDLKVLRGGRPAEAPGGHWQPVRSFPSTAP